MVNTVCVSHVSYAYVCVGCISGFHVTVKEQILQAFDNFYKGTKLSPLVSLDPDWQGQCHFQVDSVRKSGSREDLTENLASNIPYHSPLNGIDLNSFLQTCMPMSSATSAWASSPDFFTSDGRMKFPTQNS